MTEAAHIVVVDDDLDVRETVGEYLRRNGYSVTEADGGAALRDVMAARPIDLALLDISMPGDDGLTLAREIRSAGPAGIIMLTANSDDLDKIVGLEVGADDYVTKPFSPRELVARTIAVLRRVRPALAGEQLVYADLEMDVANHKVKRGGAAVALGPTEFRLLRHFLEHPGRVFSRERLLDSVWGQDSEIELRTVDVHIRRLRKAINAGAKADVIRTVRSAGYALDSDGRA